MKRFTQIFAFYLIALSFVPCGDNGGGIVDMTKHLLGIEHQAHADHEHHNNACGDDDCTPFCICSCCSLVLDFPSENSMEIKTPVLVPPGTPAFISEIPSFLFINSVWQPPNIS